MNFREIDLTIDEKTLSVFEKVKEMDEEAILLGEYLAAKKEGIESNTVHIYCRSEKETVVHSILTNECFFELEKETSVWGKGIVKLTKSYKTKTKDKTYYFHFTEKGKEIVQYQDLRLFEVYYDGKTWISEEALKDIEEKKIKPGIIKNGISTYIRMMRTLLLLPGFKLGENTLETVAEYINYGNFRKYMIEMFVWNEEDEKIKKVVENLIHKMKGTDPLVLPVQKEKNSYIEYLQKREGDISRDILEKLTEKTTFYRKETTYTFKEAVGLKQMKKIQQECVEYIRKKSVQMIFYYPEKIKMWRTNVTDETYFFYIFKEITNKEKQRANEEATIEFWKEIENYYKMLNELKKDSITLDNTFNILYEEKPSLQYKEIDPVDYLKGEILYVTVKKIGWMIINKKTKNILQTNIRRIPQLILFQDIVFESLEDAN